MSEYLPELQNSYVTKDTYEDGLSIRADATMFITQLDIYGKTGGDYDPKQLTFPRRLLTGSGTEEEYAMDDKVEILSVDQLTDATAGPYLVSVRCVLENGEI